MSEYRVNADAVMVLRPNQIPNQPPLARRYGHDETVQFGTSELDRQEEARLKAITVTRSYGFAPNLVKREEPSIVDVGEPSGADRATAAVTAVRLAALNAEREALMAQAETLKPVTAAEATAFGVPIAGVDADDLAAANPGADPASLAGANPGGDPTGANPVDPDAALYAQSDDSTPAIDQPAKAQRRPK